MWIEVSEGNWLNVSKVGRVWMMLPRNSLEDYNVCVTVDGQMNVIFATEKLSEAKAKVQEIVDACRELPDGRETWKQADAALLER